MGRLSKTHIRTGIAILIYSLIITVLFSVVMILFRDTATNTAYNSSGTLYQLSDEEMVAAIIDKNAVSIQESRLVSTVDYQSEHIMQIFSRLIPYALIFLILLFTTSLAFWTFLRHAYDRQANHLAENLDFTGESDSSQIENPTLARAHGKLKARFREQLDDSKRLYSYLSHEQKNALSILRTNMELNEQFEFTAQLGDISDSIDDVLTLSESEDSSIKGIVDVSLICAEVCDKYSKIAGNIVFEFDEETEIWAKQRWIYRAVCNLLDNAVKYGENKPIIVTVKNQHNSVVVSVQDNGIGIPYETQEKIFSHNYRVNELNQDGYGIGLSLVSHVCDLCCGFALVESTPGEGSTFYISFPAA
ncbi:signal transduction histidine kinase [Lachnospiraceae bacterium PF1-21]